MPGKLSRLAQFLFAAERTHALTGFLGWSGGIVTAGIVAALPFLMPELAARMHSPERVMADAAAAQANQVSKEASTLGDSGSGLIADLLVKGAPARNYARAIATLMAKGEPVDGNTFVGYENAYDDYMRVIFSVRKKSRDIGNKFHVPAFQDRALVAYVNMLAKMVENDHRCLSEFFGPYKPGSRHVYSGLRCKIQFGPHKGQPYYYLMAERATQLDECSYAIAKHAGIATQRVDERARAIAGAADREASNVPLFSVGTIVRRMGPKDLPVPAPVVAIYLGEMEQGCNAGVDGTTYPEGSPNLANTFPPPEPAAD